MNNKWHVGLGVIVVLASFTGLVHLTTENVQATTVSGIQYDGSGGPWTFAGNPYIVIGNVDVPAGETLTIQEGVVVLFDGYYGIGVIGTLKIMGTSTNRVTLTSNSSTPAPNDWNKIRLAPSGNAEIRYADISYGYNGIRIESSNNTVANSRISDSSNYGLVIIWGKNNTIENNNISDNNFGLDLAAASTNYILGNEISSNTRYGVYLTSSPDNTISGNNVTSNGWEGMYLDLSPNNTISNNNVTGNFDLGIFAEYSQKTVFTGNNVIANSADGIYVSYSPNCTVWFNNMSGNGDNGVKARRSNDTLVRNNDIWSNNGYGVHITESKQNNILYNNISLNDHGIYIASSSASYPATGNNISFNNVTDGFEGIYLSDNSGNSIIFDNNVSGAWEAIDLANTANIMVSNNTILDGNVHGVRVHALSTNITISGNNFTGNNQAVYITGVSGNFVIDNYVRSSGLHGIILTGGSNNNLVDRNTVLYNTENGITAWGAGPNTISNNTVYNNPNGISLFASAQYNTFENNNVTNNERGFYLLGGDFNKIIGNEISENENGLQLEGTSTSNIIYHNYIINNTNQSFDKTNDENFWNDTYPSGGNYWSDWSPICADRYNGSITPQTVGIPDAICDLQYDIDTNSVDYYPLTTLGNTPPDTTPPIITNLQPPDSSTIYDNTPTISANYSDPSDINVSSVVLEVDGIDVTSSSNTTITPTGVSYTPPTALTDSIHNVYLAVSDTLGNQANVSWSFTVDSTLPPEDTTPPTITNMQPANESINSDNQPTIGANFYDDTGINTTSIVLKIDGVEVTLDATITENGITYVPSTPLEDDTYTVYLEVKDNSTNQNKAAVTWSFTVDTTEDGEPPPSDDFLSEYWWILVIIVIAVILVFLLFIFWWRRKKQKEQLATQQLQESIEESKEV